MASRTGLIPAFKPSKRTDRDSIKGRHGAHSGKQLSVKEITKQKATDRRSMNSQLSKEKSNMAKFDRRSINTQIAKERPGVTKFDRRSINASQVSKGKEATIKFNRRSTPGRFVKSKTREDGPRSKPESKVTPGRPILTPGRSILKKLPKADSEQKPCAHQADARHVTFKTKKLEQENLRSKLDAWLAAKGKSRTPSKCRSCFDAETSEKKKGVRLLDRKITSNLLSAQDKVLDNEIRKSLFHPRNSSAVQKKKVMEKGAVKPETSLHKRDCALRETKNDQKENLAPTPTALTQEATSDYSEANMSLADLESQEEVELEAIHNNLKTMLDECLELSQGGCLLENILTWLDKMRVDIPQAVTFSAFYVTKARVLQAHPEQVLEVFCDAIRNGAQPADLLAIEMKNLLGPVLSCIPPKSQTAEISAGVPTIPVTSQMEESSTPGLTDQETACSSSAPSSTDSTPARCLPAGRRSGSIIKYSIGSTTPFLSKTPESIAVVTPVRRSQRISGRQSTPGVALREIDSISDLTEAECNEMLFKQNPAVTGE